MNVVPRTIEQGGEPRGQIFRPVVIEPHAVTLTADFRSPLRFETARLYGVNNRNVYALATAIALAVVSIAGVLFGIRTIFDPTIGPARLLYAFEVVIIGGLGSLWGTLAGGVILGVAQAMGAAFDPSWDTLAGHVVFLIVLLFRPRGLIPKTFDL